MFNNGKFKNVVAESEIVSPGERTVVPGSSMNSTIILKPKRGTTKNWIALEDTLQRSTDPEDITGVIAASAIRTQHPTVLNMPEAMVLNDERNVFAIYVSYYVKVKLTLS
uniref:Uncharacterized protein n=1 Tax=Megaselia scalaris TaxID=36166 RepID=T1GCS2_MEGSC